MSSKLVLVLNCGSSSLKFAILDAVNGDEYLSGLAECFHLPEARIKWKMDGSKQEAELGAGAAHSEALNFIVNTILAQKAELIIKNAVIKVVVNSFFMFISTSFCSRKGHMYSGKHIKDCSVHGAA